jgi:hypothetical protein
MHEECRAKTVHSGRSVAVGLQAALGSAGIVDMDKHTEAEAEAALEVGEGVVVEPPLVGVVVAAALSVRPGATEPMLPNLPVVVVAQQRALEREPEHMASGPRMLVLLLGAAVVVRNPPQAGVSLNIAEAIRQCCCSHTS